MSNIEKPIVETKSGKIQGDYQRDLFVFKGIPYAAPPVGRLRWLPPEPAKPWNSVRPAQAYGAIAPQNKAQMPFMAGYDLEEPQNEDCLYLNIWTPGIDGSRRPVMVWIHGGAFSRGSGSSPTYAGTTLSKRGDVVLVTINYRLGALGFLNLKEVTGGRIPATGNEGLLDQIASLQWIKYNIAAFGGDPDNVTIFGESAGGMSIGCLLAMPGARGLFHKAILESGANTVNTLDEAKRIAEVYLDILGLGAGDVDALKALPAERLVSAQVELGTRSRIAGSIMEPVVDGDTLPEMPIEAVKHGSADGVAIIAGTNLEEAKFMAYMNPGLTKVDEAGLVERWKGRLNDKLAPALIENYRKAMGKRGAVTTADIALALQTAVQFRMPAIRLVEAQSRRNQPAFTYLFTWKSAIPGMGACHALEIGFVFGALTPEFHGSGPAAEKLSRNIQDAWLAFARTGDPSSKGLGNWPPYGEGRQTMIMGEESHVEQAPYDEERRAWDPVPNSYLG